MRFQLVRLGLVLGVFCLATRVPAQDGLPVGWENFSVSEFILAADQLLAEGSETLPEILTAVQRRAQGILLDTEEASKLDSSQFSRLLAWRTSGLEPAETKLAFDQINSKHADPSDASFYQMYYRSQLASDISDGSYKSLSEQWNYVADWLRTRSIQELSDEELVVSWEFLCPLIELQEGIAVEWSGTITPQRTGEYQFSISPLNMNMEFGSSFHRQQMIVVIDGQPVVRAKPDTWEWDGQTLWLEGGKAVSLAAEFSYTHSVNDLGRACFTSLYWKGPGIAQSLVPGAVLRLSNSQKAGLLATCRWKNQAGDQEVESVVVPDIDQVFKLSSSPKLFSTYSPHGDLVLELSSKLLDRLFAPEVLADVVATAKGSHSSNFPGFTNPLSRLASWLQVSSSAKRREYIRKLIANPVVFANETPSRMVSLHRNIRHGAAREALDLVGTWMQLNSDLPPSFAASSERFYLSNRRPFRAATIALVSENPQNIRWLEEDYLETTGGGCCLPAAYTLGYAYLVQGKIRKWIKFLDDKLADETLEGDNRVNWLIARAMVEEIRHGLPHRHFVSRESLLAGRAWLEEARQVAESEAAIHLAVLEQASRLTSAGQWKAARQLLKQESLSGSQEEWMSLQAKVDALEIAASESQKQDEKAARQAYFDEIRRRKQRAADRGDSAAENRYSNLIGDLE